MVGGKDDLSIIRLGGIHPLIGDAVLDVVDEQVFLAIDSLRVRDGNSDLAVARFTFRQEVIIAGLHFYSVGSGRESNTCFVFLNRNHHIALGISYLIQRGTVQLYTAHIGLNG